MEAHEIVICAAVIAEDGTVYRGQHHCNCLQTIEWAGKLPKRDPISQGFITSKNRYVNRDEGYRVQIAAGIESADAGGYRGKLLFSEDLY